MESEGGRYTLFITYAHLWVGIDVENAGRNGLILKLQ
jgi:hypothetical protein